MLLLALNSDYEKLPHIGFIPFNPSIYYSVIDRVKNQLGIDAHLYARKTSVLFYVYADRILASTIKGKLLSKLEVSLVDDYMKCGLI